MGEEVWRTYDLMVQYMHKQCESSGWLNRHNSPDPSSIGVMMKLGNGELARHPPTLNPMVIAAFEGIDALIAFTMSSDITTSLFRQMSPYQTDIIVQPQGIKIPIVESLQHVVSLTSANKIQGSACIVRDEKIVLVWTNSVENFLPHGAELEKLLVETMWGSLSTTTGFTFSSRGASPNPPYQHSVRDSIPSEADRYLFKGDGICTSIELKSTVDLNEEETYDPEVALSTAANRPMILTHSIMLGLGMILLVFIQMGVLSTLIVEIQYDGNYVRLFYLLMIPFTSAFALFFVFTVVGCSFQVFHPTRDIGQNSRFYSAIAPKLARHRNVEWPHITIQIPVYKEGLIGVIVPTIRSVQKAIKHYESLGGTASIYVNEDGMQVVNEELAKARQKFYEANNVGYCARPGHNKDGFVRKGQFKKASNMNYCLEFSIRVEDELLSLIADYQQQFPEEEISAEKENELYNVALEAVVASDEGRTWASGDVRLGEIILLLDSLRLSVSWGLRMIESPDMAIIQHASGVMQVANNFFENGTTYLTNLIYNSIQFGVGSGDLACFVGHNAFLRWRAVQSVAFEEEGSTKYWSDSHVSEDFDLALRLQIAKFSIRLGTYHKGENAFKEGVSLTVFDELARWQKYAYGCNELLFHPFKNWIYKGPFTPIFLRLLFSNVKTSSRVTILGYVFTYYAMASALPLALMNYFLQGFISASLDHCYLVSFRVMFVLLIVFNGLAPICYNIMLHRLGKQNFFRGMWLSLQWMPMFIIFFGGISLHLLKAILCNFLSVPMEWNSTAKELEETGFFIGLDRIIKDFKYMYAIVIFLTGVLIYLRFYAPDGYSIIALTIIVPVANQLVCHFVLPLALGLF